MHVVLTQMILDDVLLGFDKKTLSLMFVVDHCPYEFL